VDKLPLSQEESKIAFLLLKYLQKTPDARDTLEGIIEWWLFQERIDLSSQRVKNVLSYLIAEKVMRTRIFNNQRICYELNPEKKSDLGLVIKTIERKARLD
jgi:hypothetical protein